MSQLTSKYSSISIETPENIVFEYELAGPGTRMAAYTIDAIILFLIATAIFFVIEIIGALSDQLYDVAGAVLITIIAALGFFGGYFMLFELTMNGQTPGKRVMKIRVINNDGTSLSINQVLIRNSFRAIECFFPFYIVGAAILIFTKNTQRIGDIAAGTIVIKENKLMKAAKFTWSPKSSVGFGPSRLALSREEFDFILQYVGLFKTLNRGNRNRISKKLIATIITNHKLEKDPTFIPLIKELDAANDNDKYRPAESIMKEMLSAYQGENEAKASA